MQTPTQDASRSASGTESLEPPFLLLTPLLILLEERGLSSPTTSIPDYPKHERVGGLSGPC